MSIQYQIIYWRDIPTHLRLRQGRKRHTHAMPEIFQKTVYRAAYRGKAITGDAYQDGWRSDSWAEIALELELELEEKVESGQILAKAGEALAAALIAAYDEERLNALALNKGREPAA